MKKQFKIVTCTETFFFILCLIHIVLGGEVYRIKDIYAGSNGGHPEQLTVFNNKLWFSADDGLTGRELWSSDGTDSGTTRFADLKTGTCTQGGSNTCVDVGTPDCGSGSSCPNNFIVYSNNLYFSANE